MIRNRRFRLRTLAAAALLGAVGCGGANSASTATRMIGETKEKPPGPKFHPIEPGGK